jgi:CheY-like chemotaxis protein
VIREARRGPSVLVVDDDADIRALIADLVREAGCWVCTASDGAAAMKILQSVAVDLLLTDYSMPRMNGLELIRWSRLHLPNLPALLITGDDPETLAREGEGAGALRILEKPFSSEQLLRLVGEECGTTLRV